MTSATGSRVIRPRTGWNVSVMWLAFAFNVGVAFFLSPFIVHRLGNTAYGIWALLGSLVGYMGLLDLGVRGAVMRYVARHHARHEDEEAGRIASAGLVIFGATGLVALVVSAVVAALIDRIFHIPADTVPLARAVVLIGGLNMGTSLICGVFGGTVAAMQRFDLSSVTDIVVGAVRTVAIVAALGAGAGLLGLALIQLGCTLLQGAIQYAITRRLYPQLKLGLRGVDRTRITTIMTFGVYSSLLQVSGLLIFSANSIIIGAALPVAMITFFAIAASLTDYTRSILSAISQTIAPRASALEGVGATAELERVVVNMAALATFIALPITVTFIVRGHSFLGLWMGPGYADRSGEVLTALSVALTFAAARQVVAGATIGMNRHRLLVPFYLAEGVLNVAVSLYWVRVMGILGVALGTAVPNLATTALVIPWVVRRTLGTRLRDIWIRFWLRPIAAMIPFIAVTLVIERAWVAHGLLTFFAGVAVALPVAAAGMWFIGFTGGDRLEYAARLRDLVRRRFGRG
jgi:O-antigen/teichoic acid export membrane protein